MKRKRSKELQAMKVACSNTLRTRIVKSKKQYSRKSKHKNLDY